MTSPAKPAGRKPTASNRPEVAAATTLAEKLAAFDPKLHGGEAMGTGFVGKEVFRNT